SPPAVTPSCCCRSTSGSGRSRKNTTAPATAMHSAAMRNAAAYTVSPVASPMTAPGAPRFGPSTIPSVPTHTTSDNDRTFCSGAARSVAANRDAHPDRPDDLHDHQHHESALLVGGPLLRPRSGRGGVDQSGVCHEYPWRAGEMRARRAVGPGGDTAISDVNGHDRPGGARGQAVMAPTSSARSADSAESRRHTAS